MPAICQPVWAILRAIRIRPRRFAACTTSFALLFLAGCASPQLTVTVPRIETLHLHQADVPQREIDRALSARADAYATTRPGGQAWRGSGLSMEPLLPADAWIVTELVPYPDLEPGQVVLFTGRQGRRVAHALARFTPRGWITVGVNNRTADRTLVTTANYLGVVTAAFVAKPPENPSN